MDGGGFGRPPQQKRRALDLNGTVFVALTALEPLLDKLLHWASEGPVPVTKGVIELGESYPEITVVAFDPDDVDVFCALAGRLPTGILSVYAPKLSEEDIRLAHALVPELKHPPERRHYQQVIAEVATHVGEVHELRVTAFAPSLERAVVLQAQVDWAADFFDLARRVERGER